MGRFDLRKALNNVRGPAPFWLEAGVPPSLVETRADHIVKELLIAIKLAVAAGRDPGKAAMAALGGELGGDVEELRQFASEYHGAAGEDAVLARVAHELAIVIQAKAYARMGLDVEDVLRQHVERALDEASKVSSAEVLQIVHDLLSA